MSTDFYTSVFTKYRDFDPGKVCAHTTAAAVARALTKEILDEIDFCALLSPAAHPYLEQMAQKAAFLTRQRFGNAMILFTPLYISNYCDNKCVYCSFAKQHDIARSHLNMDQIDKESAALAKSGIRHILVLTGESPAHVPLKYLCDAISIIRKHFSSIALEVYPLTAEEYRQVCVAGADSVTLYQEVYNEKAYRLFHKGGPKEDFVNRLNAPDRACSAGMHAITVGALLGLGQFEYEAFFSGLHARYLQDTYPSTEVAVAPPRMRPLSNAFKIPYPVSDSLFVQYVCALRLFLPTAGITISTRESAALRNNIVRLGVTKMSAGVTTAVGGHVTEASTAQFEIADTRSVDQMKKDLRVLGFSPVMHDWNSGLLG